MRQSRLKIDLLETFVEVVARKSFSKAAESLHISAPAVSQKISALESILQVSLLKRMPNGIVLTQSGETFLEHSKSILSQVSNAENFMAQAVKEPEGNLYVSSPIASYLPEIFCEFEKLHPKITLCLDVSEKIIDFSRDKVDLMFGFPSEVVNYLPDDTVSRKIAKSRYLFCASPNYLKENGTPQKLSDLVNHKYVAHSIRRVEKHIIILDKEQVQIAPTMEVNNARVMIDCALNSVGIIRAHYYMLADYLESGELVEIFNGNKESLSLSLSLFYPYSKHLNPAVRSFIDFMVQKVVESNLFSTIDN